jgi:hypothetical protein
MTSALALLLAAAPFDWPQVVERFADLKSFAPAATVDAPLFARIGGKCVRTAEKMPLGEGARNGHVWHWSYDITQHRDARGRPRGEARGAALPDGSGVHVRHGRSRAGLHRRRTRYTQDSGMTLFLRSLKSASTLPKSTAFCGAASPAVVSAVW